MKYDLPKGTRKIRGKIYKLIGYTDKKSDLSTTKKIAKSRGYDAFYESGEVRAGGKDFFGTKYKSKIWYMLYARKK
tara:strand:+ start:703 stop:930 length:228 start_codon:yes stop_codon:yes gene_type:complete